MRRLTDGCVVLSMAAARVVVPICMTARNAEICWKLSGLAIVRMVAGKVAVYRGEALAARNDRVVGGG